MKDATAREARKVREIQYGYECAAAVSRSGWFAGVIEIEDVDEAFVDGYEEIPPDIGGLHFSAVLRPGKRFDEWRERLESLQRRLLLVTADQEDVRVLSTADRFTGVAAAGGGSTAVLVWTERQGKQWRLMSHGPAGSSVVLSATKQLCRPACVWAGNDLVIACEYIEDGRETVGVYDGSGRLRFSLNGRSPVLVAARDGNGLLIVERQLAPESVRLFAYPLSGSTPGEEIALPAAGDLNFNAHAVADPQRGDLYVVHEACPAWGNNCQQGLYRDLALWKRRPGEARFCGAEGTVEGVIPQPASFGSGTIGTGDDVSDHHYRSLRASWGGRDQHAPIQPRVFLWQGSPAVAYKRFHPGISHVWDTVYSSSAGDKWLEPIQLSVYPGKPDAAYAIVPHGEGLLGFLPCCNVPEENARQHEMARARNAKNRHRAMEPSWNQRIELLSFVPQKAPPIGPVPANKPDVWILPQAAYDVCIEPPRMAGLPTGLTLLWGDLHVHSSYSLCAANVDGQPQDVLRFRRDVLGCQVLCLTEHLRRISCPEQFFIHDRLEMEAADRCIVLHGQEPSCLPAHDLIFYAIDRKVFDGLRTAIFAHGDERDIFAHIKREFPIGSVIAVRHFHGTRGGEHGVDQPRTLELFDPALEPAMEAMQSRGHPILERIPAYGDGPGLPHFPNNFLDAGRRIGLVGGTDHSQPNRPNHFCLTGLWVRGVTAAGVFDAIKQRKTFAVSNGKVAIYPELEGQPMGEDVTITGPVSITTHMACGRAIVRACLVRDGEVLGWQEVGARQAVVELADERPSPGDHWYVVTVEAESAFSDAPSLAQSSPFYVTVR